jgi:outer membrane protein OmpA-like peptidoglycan-associated protein
VTFLASPAHAQPRVAESNGDGMDTHLFRAALDSKGFFTVDGADILGASDASFGLVMDYGRNLMRLQDGHDADQLVAHSFQGTFGFNFGLFNLATIGLTAPVNLMSGDVVTQVGPSDGLYDSGALDVQNLSYVALHTKLRVLRPESGLGLAVALQGGIPTSESASRDLGSDPSPWFWPRLILETRIGSKERLRIGANAGYRFHNGKNPRFDQLEEGAFEYGNLLTGGLGVSFRAMDALDLVGETYMTQLASGNSDAKQKLSAEAVGGLKIFVEPRSFLMMGAGRRYTPGFQGADVRLFIGFVFEPSIGDRDGDGIKDDVDQCPDEPENYNGYEDEDGCPDVIPVPKEEPIPPVSDRDGDGIPDHEDMCPDDGGDVIRVKGPHYGCPDRDKDGIPDHEDMCPDDGGDVIRERGPYYGCPDRDKDGIPDHLDKCPDEPETYNGFEDEDGCPDVGKVVIEDNEILIMEKIMFETNSAEIRPESFDLLDAIATTLKHHPEFKLIEVGGHADERGTDQHNIRLTRDRSESVRQALIQRNIAADRLKAVGYGEFCPLDPASSEAAWEKNRRVEFKVLKTDEGDTGVVTGCERARQRGVP